MKNKINITVQNGKGLILFNCINVLRKTFIFFSKKMDNIQFLVLVLKFYTFVDDC